MSKHNHKSIWLKFVRIRFTARRDSVCRCWAGTAAKMKCLTVNKFWLIFCVAVTTNDREQAVLFCLMAVNLVYVPLKALISNLAESSHWAAALMFVWQSCHDVSNSSSLRINKSLILRHAAVNTFATTPRPVKRIETLGKGLIRR